MKPETRMDHYNMSKDMTQQRGSHFFNLLNHVYTIAVLACAFTTAVHFYELRLKLVKWKFCSDSFPTCLMMCLHIMHEFSNLRK